MLTMQCSLHSSIFSYDAFTSAVHFVTGSLYHCTIGMPICVACTMLMLTRHFPQAICLSC